MTLTTADLVLVDHWKQRVPWGSLVYVVRAGDDTPVKIGVALDVEKRLATLQTGNPRLLQVLHIFPNTSRLERALHRSLAAERLVGEWFAGPRTERFLDIAPQLSAWFIQRYEQIGRVPHFHEFTDWEWLPRSSKSSSQQRRERSQGDSR